MNVEEMGCVQAANPPIIKVWMHCDNHGTLDIQYSYFCLSSLCIRPSDSNKASINLYKVVFSGPLIASFKLSPILLLLLSSVVRFVVVVVEGLKFCSIEDNTMYKSGKLA